MASEYNSKYMTRNTSNLIIPAIEYIKENYTKDDICISSLSEMCGISEDYFRKIFKNTFGISPRKYINELKISHAEELITSEMYTVTEAAELSGYTDMSYFSREFKKAFGICPADYRKHEGVALIQWKTYWGVPVFIFFSKKDCRIGLFIWCYSESNLKFESIHSSLILSSSRFSSVLLLYSFVNLFNFGVSQNEYSHKKRMEYAKQLISFGELEISKITVICGYSEPCHFSHEFKKGFDISPKQLTEQPVDH